MKIGSGGRNRTYDKFRMKEVLCLLSYTTVKLDSMTGVEPTPQGFADLHTDRYAPLRI